MSSSYENREAQPMPASAKARSRPRWLRGVAQLLAASVFFMAPLLLLPLARAERPESWQPLGLRGETVLALAVNSSEGERILYAETHTGLWRYSAEAGQADPQWQRIDGVLPRTALGGPALAAWRTVPGQSLQLYALTGSSTARQLYRTDDGGATWRSIGPAPGQTARPAMLVLPGLGAAPDLITLTTGSRVQRSSDGGATWAPGGPWPITEAAQGADDNAAVGFLLGEASAPDRLYALAADGAFWQSESGGLSWQPAAVQSVSALAIAPYFGARIWAATAEGLAFSGDNGDSWTTLPLPGAATRGAQGHRGGRIVALRSDTRVPDTLYAALEGGAVYRSDDGGTTWLSLGVPGAGEVTALVLDPESRELLYAATDDGIWVRNVVPMQPTPAPTVLPTVAAPTPTVTPTLLPTAMPSPTATALATLTPTATATATPQPTATATRRPTRRPTATRAPSATRPPAPGLTAAPPTAPPQAWSTATPELPTATPASPTEMPTSIPPR